MGKLLALLRRTKLVYRRSSTLTKTVVIAAVAVSTVALLTLSIATQAAISRYEEDRKQAALLEQENKDLADKNDKLGSIEGAEEIAKDELGYLPSDAEVIVPEE